MRLLTLKPPEKENFLPSLLVPDSSSAQGYADLCPGNSQKSLVGAFYNHTSSPPEDMKPFRSLNESQPSPEVRLQISEASRLYVQALYSRSITWTFSVSSSVGN